MSGSPSTAEHRPWTGPGKVADRCGPAGTSGPDAIVGRLRGGAGAPGAPMASVVVVDNHEIVARSLATVLSSWGFPATPLPCGTLQLAELVAVVDNGPWWAGGARIALVDLNLRHDLDGVHLVRPLHDRGIAVAIVSGVEDRLRLACAVAAGARGLVGKAQPLDELRRTVERLACGEPAISLGERSALLDLLAAERCRLKPARALLATLTSAEARVLAELCQGRAVEEIAVSYVVSVATIRSHVHAILRKLDVHTQRDAVRLAQTAKWPALDADLFGADLFDFDG